MMMTMLNENMFAMPSAKPRIMDSTPSLYCRISCQSSHIFKTPIPSLRSIADELAQCRGPCSMCVPFIHAATSFTIAAGHQAHGEGVEDAHHWP